MKDEDYIHVMDNTRGYDGNPIVSKLLKLKYRINDAYRNNSFEFTKDDKSFVIGLIHNIRKREQSPSKIQLEECNKLWKKYEI
jgi:hypothetical protein